MQCCYAAPRGSCPRVRGYVAGTAGSDRILIRLYAPRGRRWVSKWEDRARLTAFRIKTLPPGHPCYADTLILDAQALADSIRGL